jgi:YVTN family beta-propeller protein
VYVSFGRAGSVGVIDVATRKLVKTIEDVGARPWGLGISADGTRLYAANGPSGDVAVIDLTSGTVAKRISTGGSPVGGGGQVTGGTGGKGSNRFG